MQIPDLWIAERTLNFSGATAFLLLACRHYGLHTVSYALKALLHVTLLSYYVPIVCQAVLPDQHVFSHNAEYGYLIYKQ